MHRGGGGVYNRFVPASRGRGRDKKSVYSSAIMGFDEQDLEKIKKRHRTEQEYFDADSDDESASAPKRPDPHGSYYKTSPERPESSDEEDPLDAFMAGVKDDLAKEDKQLEIKHQKKKALRQDIEELDEMEAYMKYMEDNPDAGLNTLPVNDEEDAIDYDADGNPIVPERSKIIDPLPPVDHSMIDYDRFSKNFYREHEDITRLGCNEVMELRKKLGIRVSGADPPKPTTSFGHFGFDDQLMHYIRKSDFSSPTPIQAQGVPIAMQGRDVIGIAKTGSGKTAAFVWPMLVHIMDQKAIKKGEGPIALICAPTRELAQQIYVEVKKFGKAYNIHCVCAYGGGNMHEQQRACEEGPEVIVATPGRLIDLVKKKATNLRRVTYLIFDEADRMFDMGFEPQVRSVANHVRPDRQTLLFSATFRKRVERLARDILTDPIRVVQGDIGEANQDVTQIVEICSDQTKKFPWLLSRLVRFTTEGSVLIFVTKKLNAEELANSLRTKDFDVGLLHGDMNQLERNNIITSFKKCKVAILVATDVAARGLDIPSIKNVVNYDVARDIDTHTHRIGRTGRAGEKGTAYTLILKKESQFAGDLVRNLEGADQAVPQSLLDLAMQNPYFKKSRYRAGKGKRLNIGGGGLGYRERPALGAGARAAGAGGGTEGSAMDFLGADEGETSGRGVGGLFTSRLNAMKNAFSNQYKSHFVASGSSQSTSNLSFRTPTEFDQSTGGQPAAPSAPSYAPPVSSHHLGGGSGSYTPQSSHHHGGGGGGHAGGGSYGSSQVSSSTSGYSSGGNNPGGLSGSGVPTMRSYIPPAQAAAPAASSSSSSTSQPSSSSTSMQSPEGSRKANVSFGHMRRFQPSSRDSHIHHRDERRRSGEGRDGMDSHPEGGDEATLGMGDAELGDAERGDAENKEEKDDHGWTLMGVSFAGSSSSGGGGAHSSSSSVSGALSSSSSVSGAPGSIVSSSNVSSSTSSGSSDSQSKPKRKSRWDT